MRIKLLEIEIKQYDFNINFKETIRFIFCFVLSSFSDLAKLTTRPLKVSDKCKLCAFRFFFQKEKQRVD